ncbi:PREDICTED: cytokine-like protein 1 isoform X1 [Hipposideros armiger]|uniref:Cytokine-like protein 1 isoform X1 n=1 Tax=Hipposideros armiger TaxID=186990 RepID=A0A8B7SWZ6_HIPAR|nr:PREDICTED: cytokine-like protein 1 isoform X1 [Hipposideros armiger]
MMPSLLPLLLLLLLGSTPAVQPAPPTCYSRMLSLSREITGDFQSLQATEPSEPSELCVRYLPRLYLDIHNYCVLAKLRDFVASPQCWKVAQVDALKDKVRKLYTIMNSFCRRDLVFLSDDCNALEYPIPVTTILPDRQG